MLLDVHQLGEEALPQHAAHEILEMSGVARDDFLALDGFAQTVGLELGHDLRVLREQLCEVAGTLRPANAEPHFFGSV